MENILEEIKTNIVLGKYEETYEFIQTLLRNNDEVISNLDFKFEYAKLLYVLKKFSKATIEFKNILKTDAQNIHSLLFLSKIYKEQFDCYKSLKVLFYVRKHNLLSEQEINDLIIDSLIFMKREEIVFSFLKKIKNKQRYMDLVNTLIDEIVQDMTIKNSKGESLKKYRKLVCRENGLIDIRRKNILLNEYEIYEKKVKLKSFPRMMALSITNRCNLKCKMCLQQNDNHVKKDIPIDKLSEILKFFPYLETVIWTGGEAFLHPQFNRLLDEAYRYKIKQLITTNGILITKEFAEKIVRYDIELTLSIDSIYRDTYEYIRTGAKFNELLNKINMINEYREKIKNNKMRLFMQYVISKDNMNENFGDVLDFCKKYKMTQLSFLFDKYEKNINIKNEIIYKFNKVKEALLQKAEDYKIKLFYYVPNYMITVDDVVINNRDKQKEDFKFKQDGSKEQYINNNMETTLQDKSEFNTTKCCLPWKVVYIDYNLEVFAECCDKGMGNLKNETFVDIWNGTKFSNFRMKLLEGKELSCGKKCQPINF